MFNSLGARGLTVYALFEQDIIRQKLDELSTKATGYEYEITSVYKPHNDLFGGAGHWYTVRKPGRFGASVSAREETFDSVTQGFQGSKFIANQTMMFGDLNCMIFSLHESLRDFTKFPQLVNAKLPEWVAGDEYHPWKYDQEIIGENLLKLLMTLELLHDQAGWSGWFRKIFIEAYNNEPNRDEVIGIDEKGKEIIQKKWPFKLKSLLVGNNFKKVMRNMIDEWVDVWINKQFNPAHTSQFVRTDNRDVIDLSAESDGE